VNVGGELNLDGELLASNTTLFEAAGVGSGDGTANLLINVVFTAAGSGRGRGIQLLTVPTGQTETVTASYGDRVGGANVGGELNVSTELNVSEGGDLRRFRDLTAAGSGDGIGTAILDRTLILQAAATGTAFGAADLRRFRDLTAAGSGDGIGTADLDRTLFATAAGSGDATGAATLNRSRDLLATGVGSGDGTANLIFSGRLSAAGTGRLVRRLSLTVDDADVETIATGATQNPAGIDLDGELNVGGELNVADASAELDAGRTIDASGFGDAAGVADLQRLRSMTAFGTGDGIGSGGIETGIPLIRGDTLNADFAEDESVDLNAERD
jgi:hypothetical protein